MITQNSIAELVAENLRKSIDNQTLKAGDRLLEHDISKSMNVSRTPVREAFRILQVEGYLTHKPRHGVVVSEVSLEEIEEIWEVRLYIEDLISRKTAELADVDLKKKMEKEIDKIELLLKMAEIDRESFEKLDETYYSIHVSGCGNKKLQEVAQHLRISSALIRRKPKFSERRARESLEEIKNIYKAYIDNDQSSAANFNKIHFMESLKEIRKHL